MKRETIRSRIWREEPEPDNPFAAAHCYCHGYDVYGEVLGKADWIEYLYLLFRGERPDAVRRRLLNDVAIALANPGPRDHSVRAAMNGGVGGSHAAACLMAALGVGAGQLGGGREVALAMALWTRCAADIDAWREALATRPDPEHAGVWPTMEHAPGFDPHGASCPQPVRSTLEHLAALSPGGALPWLHEHRLALEVIAGCPLAMTGVAAAAFTDLGFNANQGEYLHLLLRLPGAAVHAMEQQEFGFRHFPFFQNAVYLTNDPDERAAAGGNPG